MLPAKGGQASSDPVARKLTASVKRRVLGVKRSRMPTFSQYLSCFIDKLKALRSLNIMVKSYMLHGAIYIFLVISCQL